MEARTTLELEAEAARLVHTLVPKQQGATLVSLRGELGAGKTAFTQGMAKELGVAESVTSPTFVLEKLYELEGQPFARLAHIDAYRLDGPAELAQLGFDELMKHAETLIVLEWPEKVGITEADVRIHINVGSDSTRVISYG